MLVGHPNPLALKRESGRKYSHFQGYLPPGQSEGDSECGAHWLNDSLGIFREPRLRLYVAAIN